MTQPPLLRQARDEFHANLLKNLLWLDHAGVATNADSDGAASVAVANALAAELGVTKKGPRLKGQVAGSLFEQAVETFLRATFLKLDHLRPGTWEIGRLGLGGRRGIANYEQYSHLEFLEKAAREDRALAAALGRDYQIGPDTVIFRRPEPDSVINDAVDVVGPGIAELTSLRSAVSTTPILHACVSCKWTMRSDRAQNVRTEALNLIRNRKGKLPHIVAVTAEPLVGRIASLALGTGDIDCVYHAALPELTRAIAAVQSPDSRELLETMVQGKRLRDIADLPLDLTI